MVKVKIKAEIFAVDFDDLYNKLGRFIEYKNGVHISDADVIEGDEGNEMYMLVETIGEESLYFLKGSKIGLDMGDLMSWISKRDELTFMFYDDEIFHVNPEHEEMYFEIIYDKDHIFNSHDASDYLLGLYESDNDFAIQIERVFNNLDVEYHISVQEVVHD